MNSFWQDWSVEIEKGRQQWRFNKSSEQGEQYLEKASAAFIFDKHTNPNSADLVFRTLSIEGKDIGIRKSDNIEDALHQSIKFYTALQTKDGNWAGDYGGPLFLIPGLIVASVVTETPLPAIHQQLIARYILNQQKLVLLPQEARSLDFYNK